MKRAAVTTLAAAVVAVLSLGVLSARADAGVIPTTTTLSVSMPSVTYGQESSISFTASVTASPETPPGMGPVTVSAGSTTLCSFNLVTSDHGTSSCSISSDTLLDASSTPYSVTATFGGSTSYQASDPSDPVSLEVDQQTTTTSLGISPPEVTYGQESTVTFTAGVSPQISGSPTGVVDVDAGATVLCSIVLPATTCSTSDDPQPAAGAAASVTATYLGDANYATSTSNPQDLTVDQASTGLTLSLSASSVVVGDETTLQATATLTPEFGGTPSGSITVATTSTTLCVIVLPATSCSPSDANVLAASGTPYDVTASYPGDTNFAGSTSNTEELTVDQGNSATSLTISPTAVDFGDESSVTIGATVSSGVSGTPTGTITVAAGPTTLCTIDVATATTCTIGDTALAASGTPYAIVASYGGDGNFTPSASDPMDLTVQQAGTTTSLVGPFSATFGNEGSVTFSPTVTPDFAGTPTGTVMVVTGATTLCTFTIPAHSSCAAPDTVLPVAGSPYVVTAHYHGDADFTDSTSTPQDLTIDQASTTTGLTLSSSTVSYGNEASLTFTATVAPQFSGSTPGGTVSVMAGATTLCSITLPATQCSTTDDPLGASGTPYAVTAHYGGDTNFTGSTSTSKNLTIGQDSTTTALSISPSSVAIGSESSVVFTATVSPQFPGSPTGTITVATGGTTLCTITLPTVTPSCSTTDDPLGPSGTPYAVTAHYGGDTNFTGSTSAAQDLTVAAAATTTTLTPSASSVAFGNEDTVTFTAAVAPTTSGGPALSGVVTVATLAPSSTTLCTFDVATATSCATGATEVGASSTPYQVVATYSGDANYGGSTSTPADNLTVSQATTATTLSLSSSEVTYGAEDGTTFTATLSPQFSGSPTGTITVAAGATTLCTIPLTNTNLTCTAAKTALPASGTAYVVTAHYGGDANFTGSTSTDHTLTVDPATSATLLLLSSASVAYGSESTVVFTATVTPQFSGTPSGLVTVATSSTTLCTITLPATTCSTTDQALVPSGTPYSVTASYGGDTNFTGSTSTASNLTVTGGNSHTVLVPTPSSVAYGNESSVTLTVTVTTPLSGTPTGTATVATPTTTLCTGITLSGGSGTCTLSGDTVLAASSTPYALTATYGGDANFNGSGSSQTSLTVTKDPTATALTVLPSTVTYGSESSASFKVSVTPTFAVTPTGTVTVAAGSTMLCTLTLPATACASAPATLGAGGYTVTATYHGNPNVQGSTSPSEGVTVAQATPSAPSIANVPAGAAEEGSFVANVATSGDGSRSVVSDTTDTCTVGSDGVTVSFLIAGACTLTPQVASGPNFLGANGNPQTFTIAFGPRGYWLVGSDGGIFSFGTAQFYGSMGGTPLQRPVVGITPTHTKRGYWLVASDGGIFSFGDSNFFGSIPGLGLHPAGSGQPNSLAAPIVGMVPSSTGNGYFMVASDGGVFAFGDAKFAGSCPGIGGCAGSAVAVMPDHSGNGYWLVTSAGAIYAFGDAPFFGSPAPQGSPVVNAVATPDGHGYWILYANGAVLNFGDAGGLGGPLGYVNGFNPATSIFPTTDGLGYWVASARGDVFTYGNAPFLGSMSSTPLNGPIIAAFGF